MLKIVYLQELINSNIEWFWNNDPMLEDETDILKLWNGFKLWCVQNCLEQVDDDLNIDKQTVIKAVDENYSNWLNKKGE